MSEKSFIAKIAEIILKFTKPKYMDSQDEIEKFLAKKSETRQPPVKSFFNSVEFNGMQVFTYGKKESSSNVIIYVHGGAYINEINWQHHLFCMKLSRKLNSYVLAPVYGLAPNHTSMESFEFIRQLYDEVLKMNKNILLMGDSAGGGFVLSFA